MIVDTLGSFRLTQASGAAAGIAAGAVIYSWRWGDASRAARLRSLEVSHLVLAGYTAAQEVGFDMAVGRSFSASHTGGTAATLTGNNQKLRTSFDTTKLTDARICAAVALGGGTVTPDAQPIAQESFWALAATVGAMVTFRRYDFTSFDASGGLLLAQNEGFLLRNTVLQGAAGSGRWFVTTTWDEVLVTG